MERIFTEENKKIFEDFLVLYDIHQQIYRNVDGKETNVKDILLAEKDPFFSIAAMHPQVSAGFFGIPIKNAVSLRDEAVHYLNGQALELFSPVAFDRLFSDPKFKEVCGQYSPFQPLDQRMTNVYFNWSYDDVWWTSDRSLVSIAYTPTEALTKFFALDENDAQTIKQIAQRMIS